MWAEGQGVMPMGQVGGKSSWTAGVFRKCARLRPGRAFLAIGCFPLGRGDPGFSVEFC